MADRRPQVLIRDGDRTISRRGPRGRRSELASVRGDRQEIAFCQPPGGAPLAELGTAHTGSTPKRAAARMKQDEQLGGFMFVRRQHEAGLRAPLTVTQPRLPDRRSTVVPQTSHTPRRATAEGAVGRTQPPSTRARGGSV